MRAQSLAAWKQRSWVTWLGAIQQACYIFCIAKLTNNFPEVESFSTISGNPSKTILYYNLELTLRAQDLTSIAILQYVAPPSLSVVFVSESVGKTNTYKDRFGIR